MPNLIIKESIWTSPNLSRLSPRAELHFYRLLPLPDDFGCFESTPNVVRGRCYPLNESIRSTDIQKWQDELEANVLIVRWSQNNREYAIFPTWRRHQRIRSLHERKTPEPPQSVIDRCHQIEANDGVCQQLTTTDDPCRQTTPIDRLNPNPNPNLNLREKEISKEKEDKIKLADNVMMTEAEYGKLVSLFGEGSTRERIEGLSLYKKSTGKRYRDDYATILNWDRMEQRKGMARARDRPRELPKTEKLKGWKDDRSH